MKICPQCHKTYDDDNLNFCLDDGSVLNQAGGSSAQSDLGETLEMNRRDTNLQNDDLPETVMINQPSHTSQNAGFNQGFGGGGQQNQSDWGTAVPPQPVRKSSKSWLWVLGILGVLVILCGGGLIGFIALIPPSGNENWNADFGKNNTTANTNSVLKVDNSPTPDDGKTWSEVDMKPWVKGVTDIGSTEFSNGEFLMTAKKGFYYVICATKEFKTENASTRITVKNVDSVDTEFGYGLVFHSNPQPLQKGYAFLIDSEKQRFKIVRHVPKNELVVVKWTDSDAINVGSEENVLEVRDKNSEVEFYINGSKVATEKNSFGFRGGVAGVYNSVNSPIAFSDLEIKK